MAGRAVRYDVTARAVAPDVAAVRWDSRCCPTLPMVPSQRTSPAIRPDGSAIDPDAFLNTSRARRLVFIPKVICRFETNEQA